MSEDSRLPLNPANSQAPTPRRPTFPSVWAHGIQAVAFDMDGLLVNTEELYTEVGNTILSRRGRQFTRELKNAMTGLPGPKAFAMMIDHEQLSDTAETLAAESAEIFAEILPTKVKKLVGVEQLLDLLDEHQVPRCVATSSSHRFAKEVLDRVQLLHRMDFVVTAEDVVHGKPAPDIYQHAAERMRVETANLLVLEDSHHGAMAGVSAGACTVAVPGLHSEDHDFSGVYYRADTLADPRVVHILLNGPNAQ